MRGICTLFASLAFLLGTANAENGTSSTRPGEPVVREPSCQEMMTTYANVIEDSVSIIPEDLLVTLRALVQGTTPCRARLEELTSLLDTFWATDPWCLADERTLGAWIGTAPYLALPAEATSVLTALTHSMTLSCRERLGAVLAIVRHYAPQPFEDGRAPVLDTMGTSSIESGADQLSETVARAVKKRKRAACAKRSHSRRN